MRLITKSEKKLLLGWGMLFVASLLVWQVFAQGKKRAYFHLLVTQEKGQNALAQLETNLEQLKSKWLCWRKAAEDITALNRYFYGEKTGFEKLRQDLNILFQASVSQVSGVRYDYGNYDDLGIRKVRVNFQLITSYFSFKRFLHELEVFPKFLMVEDMRFSEIDSESGRLRINLILAAYFRR